MVYGVATNAAISSQVELTFRRQKLVRHPIGFKLISKFLVTFLKLKPKVEAIIKINVTSKLADILQQSLNPEIKHPTSERSIISISTIKDMIIVKIAADDIIALRAAVNSYLYWIQGIIDLTSKI